MSRRSSACAPKRAPPRRSTTRNICTIYDVGEDEGRPFIVMELMKGQTLRDRLAPGPLKVHQIVDIGIEIADALARDALRRHHSSRHQAGQHLPDRPRSREDPGFRSGQADAELTRLEHDRRDAADDGAGVTLGTISYMSPEQATGEELDRRTDLFSLGVVLYECATGQHPFPGKTSAVTLAAILNGHADLRRSLLNPELPVRLQEVINNCLEKDRELRYQSAADLRADLRRLRRDVESGHSRSMEVGSVGGAASAAMGSVRSDIGSRQARASGSAVLPDAPAPSSANRVTWIVGGAIAVMIAVAGGYALWRNQTPEPSPAPAQVSTEPPPVTGITGGRCHSCRVGSLSRPPASKLVITERPPRTRARCWLSTQQRRGDQGSRRSAGTGREIRYGGGRRATPTVIGRSGWRITRAGYGSHDRSCVTVGRRTRVATERQLTTRRCSCARCDRADTRRRGATSRATASRTTCSGSSPRFDSGGTRGHVAGDSHAAAATRTSNPVAAAGASGARCRRTRAGTGDQARRADAPATSLAAARS